MIIPCIDLMGGKAVQLIQGKKKALEVDDAIGLAKKWKDYTIQVIDLDAALGKGSNIKIIKKICKIAKCRVGGGIRSVDKAAEVIKAGAQKAIVGSSVFSNDKINFKFLEELDKQIGKEKVMIAIDSKKGNIVVKGWTQSTKLNAEEVIKSLEPYCSEFLYTYVDKEGMMQGTDLGAFKRLRKLTKNEITAAGGISSAEEIIELERIKVNSALGMALYTGKIRLEDVKANI
jgi:phosphoribosylformimino-5-aminoimidazole carboxamide ribotide isomerase